MPIYHEESKASIRSLRKAWTRKYYGFSDDPAVQERHSRRLARWVKA